MTKVVYVNDIKKLAYAIGNAEPYLFSDRSAFMMQKETSGKNDNANREKYEILRKITIENKQVILSRKDEPIKYYLVYGFAGEQTTGDILVMACTKTGPLNFFKIPAKIEAPKQGNSGDDKQAQSKVSELLRRIKSFANIVRKNIR